ncbi:MAG: response regulator [Proteobacteria bacterium]|nr:response regulator [Pseudomonadota bacterium]
MKKNKILIIDDSHETCRELAQFLFEQGFDVIEANSFDDAKKIIQDTRFDIIFFSQQQVLDSISENLNQIRIHSKDADIIFVGSYEMLNLVKDNLKKGISDFVLKPYNNEEVMFVLNRLIKKKGIEKKLDFFLYENIELIELISLYRSLLRLVIILELDSLKDQILEEILNFTFAKVAVMYTLNDANDDFLFYDRHRGSIQFHNLENKIQKKTLEGADSSFFFSKDQLNLPIRTEERLYCLIKVIEPQFKDGFREKEFNKALHFCEFLPYAFENAMRFEALRKCNVKDYETNAYYWDIFKDFVNKEIFKAIRYDRRLSLLGIRIENLDEVRRYHSEKVIKKTVLDIISSINNIIRESDWFVEKKVGDYLVFLTETDYFGALMTIPRIKKALTGRCIIRGAQRVDELYLNIAAVGLPLHGVSLESLLESLNIKLNISKDSLAYKLEIHKLSFEEVCLGLLNINISDQIKNDRLYVWQNRNNKFFYENLLFLLDELKIHPSRRGVFYVGFFDGKNVVTLIKNRNLQNLSTKIYFFCNENKDDLDYPGIIAVGSKKVNITDFYFILSLNEHYTYMLLSNGEKFFESSDFLLVQELISKLQSEYHLQWQL